MNACDRHSPRKQMCDCDFQPPVRPKESYPNESHLAANTHEYWIFLLFTFRLPEQRMFNEWYARDISRKIRSSQRLRGNAGVPLSLPPYGYVKSPDNPKYWIVDDEAAAVVRRIYQMCIDGYGIDKTAAIFEQEEILKPTEYWKLKGVRKPGRKPFSESPYHWSSNTVNKILTSREYMGDVVNFKTYSKSFKDKRRYENPEENHVIFEGVHEPIIDRQTWEMVQRIREGTKRRQPK